MNAEIRRPQLPAAKVSHPKVRTRERVPGPTVEFDHVELLVALRSDGSLFSRPEGESRVEPRPILELDGGRLVRVPLGLVEPWYVPPVKAIQDEGDAVLAEDEVSPFCGER